MSDRIDPTLTSAAGGDEEGFLLEERQEILAQLEETLERERVRLGPEAVAFKPRHKGTLLPLLVNGAALLLLALGAAFLFVSFNRREESLASAPAVEGGGEGRMIEAIRRDAARQLQEKDLQLVEFRARYGELSREIAELRAGLETRLQGETQGFDAALEQSLVENRLKLESQGLARTDVERRLREMEAALRAGQAERIEALKRQAAAALQEKEAQRRDWLEQYSQALRRARVEREELERSLQAQLQAMEAEALRKYGALQAENERLAAELERLRAEAAAAGGPAGAAASRPADGAATEAAPGRSGAAAAGAGGVAAGTAVTAAAAAPPDPLTERLRQEAARLEAAREEVTQADRRLQRGDEAGARRLYLAALAKVPELERGHRQLMKLEAPPLSAAPAAAAPPAPQPARGPSAEQARAAAAAEARARELERELAEARDQADLYRRELEAAGAADRRLLQALAAQRAAAASAASAGTGAEPSREELLGLVQAKLQTKEIVGSEPVRSQNPGLYEKLNRYFEEFEKISKLEGRRTALREVSGSLDRLLQQRYGEQPQPAYVRGSQEPFLQVLDRLRALLE